MSTKDLIIEKVKSINNPKLLENILRFISIDEDLDDLTREEEKSLQASLENVKKGKVLGNKEAKKIMSEWLNVQSSGL